MSAGARVSVSGCIRVSPAVYGRFFPISSREDLPGSVATGGFPDPLERLCLGAVDAFRVHLQQDRNAMAGQARIALLNSALILSLGDNRRNTDRPSRASTACRWCAFVTADHPPVGPVW